jgi:hypothetical protein
MRKATIDHDHELYQHAKSLISEAIELPEQKSICKFLVESYGFDKCRRTKRGAVDADLFSHFLRIHEVHYLFYSPVFKTFSLAVAYEDIKGKAGGGYDEFKMVVIPKTINTVNDAETLMAGMGIKPSHNPPDQ